jgi:hypothetical protein
MKRPGCSRRLELGNKLAVVAGRLIRRPLHSEIQERFGKWYLFRLADRMEIRVKLKTVGGLVLGLRLLFVIILSMTKGE